MTCVHNNVHAQCLVDIVFVDLPTSIVDLIVANWIYWQKIFKMYFFPGFGELNSDLPNNKNDCHDITEILLN